MDPMETSPAPAGPIPATPQREGAASGMSSTPYSTGLASAAEYSLEKVMKEIISPYLLIDVKDNEICDAETFLRALLQLCCPKPNNPIPQSPLSDTSDLTPLTSSQTSEPSQPASPPPKSDLFQQCLQKVVDTCHNEDLRAELNNYRRVRLERERYQYFIRAANLALKVLSGINFADNGLPAADSNPEILFHMNDKNVTTTRLLGGSLFKPDIVVVTRGVTRGVAVDGDLCKEADLTSRVSTTPLAPGRNFAWGQILMSVELKTYGKTMAELESNFDANTPIKTIPPLVVNSLTDRSTQAESMPLESKSDAPMSEARKDSKASADPVASGSTRVLRSTLRSSGAGEVRRSNRLAEGQGSESSSKRKAGEILDSGASKKRRGPIGSGNPPRGSGSPTPDTTTSTKQKFVPAVQSAIYALERFNHAPTISHVLNLVIDDDVARLFWYDREGVVQSNGINMFTNLPHFMVLLLILQRFSLAHWGVIAGLEQGQEGGYIVRLPGHGDDTFIPDENFSSSINLTMAKDPIYARYSLLGRGTMLFKATVSENQSELVAKLYWPEESRDKEGDIIEQARIYGQASDRISGHIPDLILSQDFSELSTSRIRGLFGFKSNGKTRVFRIIVFHKLCPIIELKGKEFWTAYWECFICHYELWKNGIHHGDISVNNLMYCEKDGIKSGVLNDFDLARLTNSGSEPTGRDRTGTMPFMALDLLTQEGFDGKLNRLYRHDAESFAWSLMYIFICIDHSTGKPVEHKKRLRKWLVTDYEQCQANKLAFQAATRFRSTDSYKKYWKTALKLVFFWIDRYTRAFRKKAISEDEDDSDADDEDDSDTDDEDDSEADDGGSELEVGADGGALPALHESPPEQVFRDVMDLMTRQGFNIMDNKLKGKGKGKGKRKGRKEKGKQVS